jgi:TatA/E family protein of Tat protein translocase
VLPGLTPVHIFVVLVVALLVFGPTKLPELARQVGAAMNVYREFRDRVHTELNPHAIVQSFLDGPEPTAPGATESGESAGEAAAEATEATGAADTP